ncbi:hypothetical protein ACIQ4I_03510 [Rummeliibacillus sp. NPDC094406]|uniref:hypothetical protein n=1 Tax=Rummeliibacillus sp. NPDC094406 TaxID=3364511 RepID=UPI0038014DCC
MEVTFLTTPESYGEIPFNLTGKDVYKCGIYFEDREENHRIKFCINWIEKIDRFPVYFLFEAYDFMTSEIEKGMSKKKILFNHYTYLDSHYYKGSIENIEQFKMIFPYIYGNGCMNQFAAVSLIEDVCYFQDTEPVINMKGNAIVIGVDLDGDAILFLSKNNNFSNLTDLIASLPSGVQYNFNEE